MGPLRLFIIGIVCMAGLVAHSALAQVLMSGGNYVQTFDSLARAGDGHPWTNNVTLAGWYASRSVSPYEVTNYDAATGSDNHGAIYSFGAAAGSGERALGSIASMSRGEFAYGVRFINDTGLPRTNIVVSYTGEQWRVASTNVQTLRLSYRIGITLTNADARNDDPWIAVPVLGFNSPQTNATAQAVNGNAPSNRFTFASVVLAGVVVPAGQELFLRWFDENDSGGDDAGLAIENVTVSVGEAVTNLPPVAGFSLVAYNVGGDDVSDWSTNVPQVQAIARQLRYLNPDIVAFNEIPKTNGIGWEMTNWITAFFPGYQLAISPGSDSDGVISRFPIIRSNSWFKNASLTNYGYAGTFTRDLFEAVIDVPGFPQPLHVFVTHLKAGQSLSNDAALRAAEARVISNFFANGYLTTNALQPYLLAGDLNEDMARPATGSQQPIQTLTNRTGLILTTTLNPVSLSPLTHSIQNPNGLNHRYDYILPNALLFSNIVASQVFRTDLLANPPPPLLAGDDVTASDHLPVVMAFTNPYTKPFRMLSLARTNQAVTLTWESVPGQRYGVEQSADLITWSALGSAVVATAYTASYTRNVVGGQGFFRVLVRR